MDINKYRIFLQSVDSGSFSKVAEETGYTPSGIVHMMNTLESEMGFPLLVRSRRGVRLTPDGERVAPILRSPVSYSSSPCTTTGRPSDLRLEQMVPAPVCARVPRMESPI